MKMLQGEGKKKEKINISSFSHHTSDISVSSPVPVGM